MKSSSFLAAAIVIVAACGGSSSNDLFNGGAGGATDGGGSSGEGGGDSTSDGGGGIDGGGGTRDGGGTNDGGVKSDGGAAKDGGPPTVDPGILCAAPNQTATYCATGQQHCCIVDGITTSYTCEAANGLCATGTIVSCDDTADCNGGVCCGAYDKLQNAFTQVRCQATCTNGSNTTGVRFCDPNVPGECPNGHACVETSRLPGYHVCTN